MYLHNSISFSTPFYFYFFKQLFAVALFMKQILARVLPKLSEVNFLNKPGVAKGLLIMDNKVFYMWAGTNNGALWPQPQVEMQSPICISNLDLEGTSISTVYTDFYNIDCLCRIYICIFKSWVGAESVISSPVPRCLEMTLDVRMSACWDSGPASR